MTPVDPRQLRGQIEALRKQVPFLLALLPDGPRYKLWLGDVVELAQATWGMGSPRLAQVRAVLTRAGRLGPEETEDERREAYLRRLNDLDTVLAAWERALLEPVTLIDLDPDGGPRTP